MRWEMRPIRAQSGPWEAGDRLVRTRLPCGGIAGIRLAGFLGRFPGLFTAFFSQKNPRVPTGIRNMIFLSFPSRPDPFMADQNDPQTPSKSQTGAETYDASKI